MRSANQGLLIPRRRLTLTRREFLRLTSAGVAVAALPACGGSAGRSAASGRFLTADEYATLDAVIGRLIPNDTNPDGSFAAGAGPARVVDYVDRLLGAFETDSVPFLFAGGPASDRNPEPAPALCGETVPPNGAGPNRFEIPVPLSRRQAISWKATILGTAGLGPEADFLRVNQRALGAGDENGDVDGLQQVYRRGLEDLNDFAIQLFGRDFVDLSATEQDLVIDSTPNQGFVSALYGHTVEGMYANPEYGGNQPPDRSRPATGADGDNRPAGWSYIGFEGDRQPLGYAVFDPATEAYCELPGHPLSTAGSGPDASPLDPVLGLVPALLDVLHLRR